MIHSILLTLLATATLPPTAPPAVPARIATADPVIKVWTDWEEYSRGQTAQAHIRTREDGYVIVLQADVDGRVRVVFPLDPGDDDYVRGGHDIDLAGRGGKGSFYVDGPPGMGAVYAAISPVPFRFTDFVKGDHWDYGSLYDKSLDSDFESGFTAIVDRMSAGHFDYDIYRYRVEGQGSYASADSYAGPTYIGSPCWVAPYDPFCGGPTYLPGTFYGMAGPYGYGGPGVGFGYGSYGWSVGVSFGLPYYGYGYGYGYPYYGGYYGGYPYYGGGYYGGYPYYGYPHGYYSGYPNTPYYSSKPGSPGGSGVTGVGYRPRGTVGGTVGGTTGGMGIGYRGTTGTQTGTLGMPTGIEHRGRTNGWTLGRPSASRPMSSTDPRRRDGGNAGGQGGRPNDGGTYRRPYDGARSGGYGDQPSARPPRNEPPRYEPGTRSEPRGRAEPSSRGASPSGPSGHGASGYPQGGGRSAPSGHAPSAPHSGGGSSHPSSPPSHSGGGGGGGGGGHRVP